MHERLTRPHSNPPPARSRTPGGPPGRCRRRRGPARRAARCARRARRSGRAGRAGTTLPRVEPGGVGRLQDGRAEAALERPFLDRDARSGTPRSPCRIVVRSSGLTNRALTTPTRSPSLAQLLGRLRGRSASSVPKATKHAVVPHSRTSAWPSSIGCELALDRLEVGLRVADRRRARRAAGRSRASARRRARRRGPCTTMFGKSRMYGDVEDAVVRRAVGPGQAGAVEREDDRQVLQRDLLEDLVERPLQERASRCRRSAAAPALAMPGGEGDGVRSRRCRRRRTGRGSRRGPSRACSPGTWRR